MGLFDSLAMGAGRVGAAASSGLLAGQQAEAKQRHLDALMNYQYAKLQEGQATQKSRLTFQEHQAQSRLVAPLIKQRYDQGMQRYWDDNPDMAAKVDRIINAHMNGTAFDPGDMAGIAVDPNSGSVHLPGQGAPGVTAPGPPDTGPAPPPPDYTGPNTQPSAFDFAAGGVPGAPGPPPDGLGGGLGSGAPIVPPGAPQPPPPGAPFGPSLFGPQANFGGAVNPPPIPPVFSGEPVGGLPPYTPPTTSATQGPITTSATTGPAQTIPAAPPSLADQLRAKYQAGPRRHQTDKAFKDEIAAEAKIAGIDLREVMTGAMAPLLGARTGEALTNTALGIQKGQAFPAKSAADLAHTEAGTEYTKEQIRASRLLTPAKLTDLQAKDNHMAAQEQQTATNAAEAHRHNVAAEGTAQQNADTRKREVDAANNYRATQIKRLNQIIKMAPAMGVDKQELTGYAHSVQMYTAGGRDYSGAFVPTLPPDQRAAALTNINQFHQKHGLAPLSDVGLTGGGASGPTAPAATAPAAVQGKPSAAEAAAMRQMIQSGSVHSALQHADPIQGPRIRFVYRQMTGKDL